VPMWLVPGVVLGVATTFLQLAWLLSFFHVGADVDGLAYHLDQPTVYGW
jgi:hypothetical protein